MWSEDLSKSIEIFDQLIHPVLSVLLPKIGEFKYIRVEGSPEEIAQKLDQNIGIDALLETENITYALGNRIQINSGVWNSFTIRTERESGHITELEKLQNAVKKDAMRPNLTLQAYVIDNQLKSAAIAMTRHIIDFINKYDCPVKKTFDGKWVSFKVVDWDRMQKKGYPVSIYKPV